MSDAIYLLTKAKTYAQGSEDSDKAIARISRLRAMEVLLQSLSFRHNIFDNKAKTTLLAQIAEELEAELAVING